jgi:hypothetical protein
MIARNLDQPTPNEYWVNTGAMTNAKCQMENGSRRLPASVQGSDTVVSDRGFPELP